MNRPGLTQDSDRLSASVSVSYELEDPLLCLHVRFGWPPKPWTKTMLFGQLCLKVNARRYTSLSHTLMMR